MKFRKYKIFIVFILVLLSMLGCGSSEDIEKIENTPVSAKPQLGDQTIRDDGSIDYIDYMGKKRNALKSAADAEYHTGTGFGKTLFDSADKKCQHCHNELYDTWKDSMHAKSWQDPIFQAKFQDFLRTHINKIGEDKREKGGIKYSEKMFKGVAQTCIKCHAPGAYYAGDFKVSLELIAKDADTAMLNRAKKNSQSNLAPKYNPDIPASVVAVSHTTKNLYKATYQIGHEANTEGINCAFCHSIETPRLIKSQGGDNGLYTLKGALKIGPHGPKVYNAGDKLYFDTNASSKDMNAFFRIWGPEKYSNFAKIPKGGDGDPFDKNKTKDGRYTMHSIDINGTNSKVHFTGGPFYGPFGITGISNENKSDQTNRAEHINPYFDVDTNNHFGKSAKTLCLSCHQRSSGAKVPSGHDGEGSFMELCSTQVSISTGGDIITEDTPTSPKCQKCHMERIEGTVLHKWARPDQKWTLADNPHLVAQFNPENKDVKDNPVRDGWLNSHAFLGASKTGHKKSVVAKIKSGFNASIKTEVSGDILTVTTTLTNKTAHMFPGAHPMRRVLSRLVVTDKKGNKIPFITSKGKSTFTDIQNKVEPIQEKKLHSSAAMPVEVQENSSANLNFPGKTADLDGAVSSQKFHGGKFKIKGADNTIKNQIVNANGKTEGNVTNSAIVNSDDKSMFTRIYGRETGKIYNGVFVVRPGFDSNIVGKDNRLSPNETETYTLTYDISTKEGVKAVYKIYYMQKGANGMFISGEDGFLDKTKSDAKKLLVSEVGSYIESL